MQVWFPHIILYVFVWHKLSKLRYVSSLCCCHGVPIIRDTLGDLNQLGCSPPELTITRVKHFSRNQDLGWKHNILLLSRLFSSTVFKYNVPRRWRGSVSVQGPIEYIGLHNKCCAYGFAKIIFTDLQSTLQNILTFISALKAQYGEGTIYAL